MVSQQKIARIQQVLRETGIDAWVLYNFRDLNGIACRLLGIDESVHQTRRWVAVIPQEGTPRGMIHAIEPHLADHIPGEVRTYSSLDDFTTGLSDLLSGFTTVAMEYSPKNAIPVVARVDAGTIELVRSTGVDVRSSGELIARVESSLSPSRIESAREAGAACRRVMALAFNFIGTGVAEREEITEHDVVQFILQGLAGENLITDHDPNCSVGPNSANPHYQPGPLGSTIIREGDFVLIDLWGRSSDSNGVYGDITWTGVVGTEVPQRVTEVFNAVRDAREAALELVRRAFEAGDVLTGAEVDRAARQLIVERGYGEYFIHRTGHSITHELHGAGTNLDALETIDERPLIPASSFSIEPGIYLPGEFGVRSEIDVAIDESSRVHVTSSPAQSRVLALFDPNVLAEQGMLLSGGEES